MSTEKTYCGSIPSNLDLDVLFIGVERNKTYKQYLKEGMVYFLSLLTISDYNQDIIKDGFRTLNIKVLEDVIGRNRPSEIIKILRKHNVIEIRNHRKGYYSRGYRYCDEYRRTKQTTIEYSGWINEKLQHRFSSENKYIPDLILSDRYKHLESQFKNHTLGFDQERVLSVTKSLGETLLEKTVTLKKFQNQTLDSVFNYLGRIVKIIDDIEDNDYYRSLSETNLRVNSVLTSLPKIIRKYLLINGRPVGEVDIKSSHPFILSTILDEDFVNSNKGEYRLGYMYGSFEQEINNLKSIIPNPMNNPNNILGTYLDDTDYRSLMEFSKFDFKSDFYTHLLNEGRRIDPDFIESHKEFQKGRNYVKDNIMSILFGSNENVRNSMIVGELVRLVYPGLYNYTEKVNQYYTKREFSLLLQRIESYLVLEKVCKHIHSNHPKVPFFTIHDCIITTQSNLELVRRTMSERISEITNKDVGVEIDLYNPSDKVPNDDVVDIWKDLKITSEKKYNKLKIYHRYDNIIRGIDLLFSGDDNKYWKRKMKVE